MSTNLLQSLSQERIVAIIRGISAESGDATAKALADGGIVFLEVTLNTDGALGMISRFREQYEGRMRIGAGTVLDLSQAKEAVAAGAEYIISPNLDEEVVYYGVKQGIDVWPGTMTPTEMVRAYKAGASAVKVFPMGALGVNYLKEVRAPLNHIPMIGTGGVNLSNIRTVLESGAIAVGLGGNLVDKQLVKEGKFDELTKLAQSFVAEVKGAN
ncbi:bifunctional 4-hydroxy-2-oxoglutarate aldolase/2-dehydro-3-deoxy-phosphogluconate aldolase [Cohnella lubricantis]|uniref:Bifunctional 4-hydroxy-2-oxoglutarate aldolase/2-dehydro-3-deoxy-phosphogluconate aldolase n=1 Tax=Cohnella lubricantis TaxID=2163172 RepID=A0A841T8W2_9BACL|nr:bifunctional 4-hydroxy-2-oxoglutarate aldolase/2-dehydro-3-deoxy-phosphogluconate aldolase [Cohnella lubricantis]MBB6676455.1 bifunctional 4-hydroxy-2-oxoglutarate aldolase/2-dehydro-3-deoxy-phosphogluconate aldolase [Cohnella lubricantis]MBP2117538.1 2-dehydro-3-deoxyphosphogluconate aldolase/(4S)-4-hydroxy-2-oxoglutarate aldolase [Cohnella lubricantis]